MCKTLFISFVFIFTGFILLSAIHNAALIRLVHRIVNSCLKQHLELNLLPILCNIVGLNMYTLSSSNAICIDIYLNKC